MKALVGAFNQEKAIVGAFSMIEKHRLQHHWRPCQVRQYRQWVWRCPRYAAPVSTPLHCAAVNCSIKVSHQENYSQCNKTLYLDNKQTRGWHVVAQDVNVILFAIPMVKCKVMWCYKLWRWSTVQLCSLQCSCSTKQRQGECAVIGMQAPGSDAAANLVCECSLQ